LYTEQIQLEDTEDDFHGSPGAAPSDARDWLNKDEKLFGYQNLTGEEIAQQAEEDEENKIKIFAKLRFSEVKQTLDFIISFTDSNPQYNKYYLMLREMRRDVIKEQHKKVTQNQNKLTFLNAVSIILSNTE
jgi:hypothetical protein